MLPVVRAVSIHGMGEAASFDRIYGPIHTHCDGLLVGLFLAWVSVRNPKELSMVKFLRTFLTKVPTPSAFLLRTANGGLVAGTLKADGMADPISTHYFKHGTAGLADIHLVGIKEVPSQTFSLPNTQLMAAGQQAAGALGLPVDGRVEGLAGECEADRHDVWPALGVDRCQPRHPGFLDAPSQLLAHPSGSAIRIASTSSPSRR